MNPNPFIRLKRRTRWQLYNGCCCYLLAVENALFFNWHGEWFHFGAMVAYLAAMAFAWLTWEKLRYMDATLLANFRSIRCLRIEYQQRRKQAGLPKDPVLKLDRKRLDF